MIPTLTSKVVVLAVLALAAFGAGWTAQGWRLNSTIASNRAAYADNIQKITEAGAKAERDNAARLADVQRHLAVADAQHTKELADANREISAARNALAHGSFSVRLSSASGSGGNGVPGSAGAARLGHGAAGGRAVIDTTVAEHLLALGAEADRTRVKLAACQAYVAEIQRLGDKK